MPSYKIKIYDKHKWSRSRDKGYASYICYYKGHSIDIFGVYSPKAAIRKINKLIKLGKL
jgi:hypothetical protein